MPNYANSEVLVDTQWVADRLDDPKVRVVESNVDRSAYDSGHIPGAASAPWADNLGPDGRFLPPERLRERYAALGAADRPVVAYCGSSLTATHDLLALEVAGLDGARLYEGSWSHWSSDPSRPTAVGAER